MLSEITKPLLGIDNIDFAYVYGSYAKGQQKEHSDLDIAVYVNEPDPSLDLTRFAMSLKLMLEDIAREEVHLVMLNIAPPLLKQQVLKYGTLVFERNRQNRIAFIKKSYFEFFQYQNMLNKIIEIKKKKIREKIAHDR